MTAPVHAAPELSSLDGLLVAALAELRSARIRSARAGDRDSAVARDRAESHLNALLDLRSSAMRRRPRV